MERSEMQSLQRLIDREVKACDGGHRSVALAALVQDGGRSARLPVENHAPAQDTRASANAPRACLVWWWGEPAWCPGKNEGSCAAVLARYTAPTAAKSTPSTIRAAVTATGALREDADEVTALLLAVSRWWPARLGSVGVPSGGSGRSRERLLTEL